MEPWKKSLITFIPLLLLGVSCIPDVYWYKITYTANFFNKTKEYDTSRGLFTHNTKDPSGDYHTGSLGKKGDNAWCSDENKHEIAGDNGDNCCKKIEMNLGLMMTSLAFAFLFWFATLIHHHGGNGYNSFNGARIFALLSFIFALASIFYTEQELAQYPYCESEKKDFETHVDKKEILPGAYLALFPGAALMGIFTIVALPGLRDMAPGGYFSDPVAPSVSNAVAATTNSKMGGLTF